MDQFLLLIDAAETGPPIEGIAAVDRAMMYILSAWTGYRKGEIGSLTLRSFDLSSEPPTVTVQAVYSKRKRTDVQVLPPDVVARLTEWLERSKRETNDILFPVSGKVPGGIERSRKMAQMGKKRHGRPKEDKKVQTQNARPKSLQCQDLPPIVSRFQRLAEVRPKGFEPLTLGSEDRSNDSVPKYIYRCQSVLSDAAETTPFVFMRVFVCAWLRHLGAFRACLRQVSAVHFAVHPTRRRDYAPDAANGCGRTRVSIANADLKIFDCFPILD